MMVYYGGQKELQMVAKKKVVSKKKAVAKKKVVSKKKAVAATVKE